MINGYSGYYNGVFLRSTLEFAYAYYLDSKSIKWRYELKAYNIGEHQYKPDFFILDDRGNLLNIVELKGDRLIESGTYKVNQVKALYNIDIMMLTQTDIVKLYRKEMNITFEAAKRIWINDYNAKLNDRYVDNEKNPMYGLKHSDKTKLLISQKVNERLKDPQYRKKSAEAMIRYNRSNNFACARKLRSKRVYKNCLECGVEFTVTEADPKNRKFCGLHCAWVYNGRIGNQVSKDSALAALEPIKTLIYDWVLEHSELVLSAKLNKISTVLYPLFNLVESKYAVRDKRTISKAIFGEDRGRKELLLHLKEFVMQHNVRRPESELTDCSQHFSENVDDDKKCPEVEDKKPLR